MRQNVAAEHGHSPPPIRRCTEVESQSLTTLDKLRVLEKG